MPPPPQIFLFANLLVIISLHLNARFSGGGWGTGSLSILFTDVRSLGPSKQQALKKCFSGADMVASTRNPYRCR